MSLIRGLFTLLKFVLKASIAVGIVAGAGAAIYAAINKRGGPTSYVGFADVPANPATERVS